MLTRSPAIQASGFLFVKQHDSGPPSWYGTLAQEHCDGTGDALPAEPVLSLQRDGSGLMYMRNRYYDPQSGRFTQEDPIGLAGGMNLYGFAEGDPVNYSDPFGLMSCPPMCYGPASLENALRVVGAGARALAANIAESATEFWAEHGDRVLETGAMVLSRGTAPRSGRLPIPVERTAGGRPIDKYGNVLGPSGEVMVNRVRHATEKRAKDAARLQSDGAPVKHPSPARGEAHYHPTKRGEKIPGSAHHEYPPE